jgi:DNA-binding transcriptional ArsR family regulator
MFEFMNITKAMADANRIRILMALRGGELCVCQIIVLLNLSPSTVSAHLSILRNARLIVGRKEGRWMYYRLNGNGEQTAAIDAIRWVVKSVGNEPVIVEDQRKLAEITSPGTGVSPENAGTPASCRCS